MDSGEGTLVGTQVKQVCLDLCFAGDYLHVLVNIGNIFINGLMHFHMNSQVFT